MQARARTVSNERNVRTMTENIEIKTTIRATVGKANRRLGDNELAAVVYGAAVKSVPVSVDRHAFQQILIHEGNISSKLITLTIDGGKPIHAIVKSLQHDPMKGSVTHVDFWAVNMKQQVSTTVPVHFEGEAPGVHVGGVLMHSVQHINVEALPDHLPEFLTYDISAMEIGDVVHVRDLIVPKGVTVLDPEGEIVASIVPPVVAEEVEPGETSEPEVIGAKSDEE